MSIRIAHLSDTQIRNFKRHWEYRESYEYLYDSLKKKKPDIIVFAGDLAHSKTHISPEFVKLCSEYIDNISDIAPFYILPGNHDLLLTNLSRLDALSPIIDVLKKDSIVYCKESGIYSVNDGLNIIAWSCVDEKTTENWPRYKDFSEKNKNKINVCLFHGFVDNSILQNNFTAKSDYTIEETFKQFDYGMFGDIHKMQFLDDKKKYAYCGSFPQQNYSESVEKGYLLWDIESKDRHSVDFIKLKNVCPFYTVYLNDQEKDSLGANFQKNARIRIYSDNKLNLVEKKEIKDLLNQRCEPLDIKFVDKNTSTKHVFSGKKLQVENLRDKNIQEKLIREYLEQFKLDEKIVDDIVSINTRYNVYLEKENDIIRNVQYSIKKIEFSNIGLFGEDNIIDFDEYKGITGIFGKNGTGKSTYIADVPSYCYFNKVSKNIRNYKLINENKESCYANSETLINNDLYKIQRSTKVFEQGHRKGEVYQANKTDVDFSVIRNFGKDDEHEEELNDEQRRETDKIIRRIFGTFEDYSTTVLVPQFKLLSFVDAGSTDRKKVIGKYLDLEQFEQKYSLANDEISDVKSSIKEYENIDFDSEIEKYKSFLIALNGEYEDLDEARKEEENEKNKNLEKINQLSEEIQNIDVDDLVEEDDIENEISILKIDKKTIEKKIDRKKKLLKDKIRKKIKDLKNEKTNEPVEKIKERLKEFDEQLDVVRQYEQDIYVLHEKIENLEKDVLEMQNVPCITNSNCCYNEKMKETSVIIDEEIKRKNALAQELLELRKQYGSEARESLESHLEHQRMVSIRLKNECATEGILEAEIKSCKNEIKQYDQSIENKLSELRKVRNYKKQLKRNKELKEEIKKIKEKNSSIDEKLSDLSTKIKNKSIEIGSNEAFLKDLKDKYEKYNELKSKFIAFEYFMKAMSKDGIMYNIISENLDVINNEVNRILSNSANFEIILESEPGDKGLDIVLQYKDSKKRDIEQACGMEKTLAEIAIRAALINITSLPKSNMLILDESFAYLDTDYLDSVTKFLACLSEMFEHIFIITHNELLKDIVDNIVIVSKNDEGYSVAT